MILDALFERRSFENPKTSLSSPAAWLTQMFGGNTDSGARVDEVSALSYSAVLAAIRVISESIAVLPLMLYRRDGRDKVRENDHPVFELIHNKPNDEMTPSVFKETIQGHAVSWGNGYAVIDFSGGGRPVSIRPLLPDRTRAVRKNGNLLYVTRTDGGSEVDIRPDRVVHIPGFGFDGLSGYSPIYLARQAIGLGVAFESFSNQFFKNGAWMGGVLEHPDVLSDEAMLKVRDSFTSAHGGIVNAFKPAILEEGMTWKQIGVPAKDAMFLEARKFQVTEIARMYRVPPHMLGDLERATFSNIEQMSLEFVKYTLAIWIAKWEQELTRKLIVGRDAGELFIEFNVDAFLRGDSTSRYQNYKVGRDGGWLSINNILRLENMPPIEGGDEHIMPKNFDVVGDGQAVDDDTPARPEAARGVDAKSLAFAHRFTFNDAAARIARRQCDRVKRAAGKADGDFVPAIYKVFEDHKPFMIEALTPAASSLVHSVGTRSSGGDAEDGLQDIISRHVDRHCEAALRDAVSAYRGKTIESLLSGWSTDYPAWWGGLVDSIVSYMSGTKNKE